MATSSQNTKFLVRSLGQPLEAASSPHPISPTTPLEPNEVLIRVRAIAVNPADCKMIDAGHRISNWPLVAGLDGAGVVEAKGEAVSRFAVGEEVLSIFSAGDRGGSFQTLAVVQERSAAKKPASWQFGDAASLSVCFCTAIVGLGLGLRIPLPFLQDEPKSAYQPSSVLVLGGSSALGAATIQLLRLAVPDCRILATSSPAHHGHLTDYLGADRAFDRNAATLVEDVKAASSPSGKGVDAIFDAVGAGRMQPNIFDAMDLEGSKRYAQVWTGDDEIEVPTGVDSVMFRSRDLLTLDGGSNLMVALQNLLARGEYKAPVPVENVGKGLEGLEKALELMRVGVSGKKLVVSV